ncbi:hypothetical protein HJC23_004137 [Cyclotella cryptica]|uniref:Uncharacterized protein n=1 Tax=Cyclotella cryptica TaxID=29204 RepID=A0ABD3PHR0_9STRA
MHSIHTGIRNDKRSTGIKLIQKRWTRTTQRSSTQGPQQKCKRTLNDKNLTRHSYENDDSSVNAYASVHPALLFRQTNIEYCSMMHYCNLHFLNSSTILANDSRGRFDLVGICNGKGNKDGDQTVGRLLANGIKLSSDQYLEVNASPLEVYGYQGGAKFAVGLPSGDVEIFSTERTSTTNVDETWYPSVAEFCLCLPRVTTQHIGPRRLFKRNIHYSLQYMLSVPDHELLIQDSNDYCILKELRSCSCGNESLSNDRTHHSVGFNIHTQWAFREGGIGSSSALIGACKDREGDCFSLSIIDERNQQAAGRQRVFAEVPYHSQPYFSDEDNLVSICFTGEYGLATGHCTLLNTNMLFENTLKWHDLRMIWKQPVKSMNLSFPQNEVAAIVPLKEMEIKREKSTSITGGGGVVDLHLVDHTEQQEQSTSFRISKLTGSNDSSDRFVVTLQEPTGPLGKGYEHMIVDSSLRQVVQDISGISVCEDEFSPFCFSSYLDCMALSGERISSARDVVSIFDISRHRSVISDAHTCDNRNVPYRPMKRKSSSPPNIIHSSGYLGSFKPTFLDVYGLESTLTCMAMDDLGSTIAFGTSDGDIYVLRQ